MEPSLEGASVGEQLEVLNYYVDNFCGERRTRYMGIQANLLHRHKGTITSEVARLYVKYLLEFPDWKCLIDDFLTAVSDPEVIMYVNHLVSYKRRDVPSLLENTDKIVEFYGSHVVTTQTLEKTALLLFEEEHYQECAVYCEKYSKLTGFDDLVYTANKCKNAILLGMKYPRKTRR